MDFKASGSSGKCIEGREFIIALPESFVQYRADDVVRLFTESFHKRYDVECTAALHHNKTKTNYHIHLVFSERKILEQPEVKVATRNMFYDEQGKHRRTKKEILDEQGNLRVGCSIIPKGEVYESHIFTKKDEWFKNKYLLRSQNCLLRSTSKKSQKIIRIPTGRRHIYNQKSEEQSETEIKADNGQAEWNRTVDVALVGALRRYFENRQEKNHRQTLQSIRTHGWLDMFRQIIRGQKIFTGSTFQI
ncbi:MAG: MobA/MobL family protein [Anaerostipes caccae]|uniref:MobA/MobL family protein n=1 Tax=Anaerostipes caccae TaxID=105841 RepID=UPI00399F396A